MAPSVMPANSAQSELALHLAATSSSPPAVVKETGALSVGTLLQCDGGGEVPSLAAAAKERRLRLQSAVRSDPEGVPWLECGELGETARSHVQRWAMGLISGQRCLLELGLCSMASELIPEEPKSKGKPGEAVREHVASLWVVGVPGLWAHERCLQALAADFQERTPAQLLQEAWNVVEFQCGETADRLHPDEINLALRRLSMQARHDDDPSAFVRVQLWRELLYIETGAGCPPICSAVAGQATGEPHCLSDSSIIRWLRMSDADIRVEAQCMVAEKLLAEVAQLEIYASQILQLDLWLRQALEGWQRPDAYRALGIAKGASVSEVRRAFHKLALQRHPDKGGAKEEFQKLQQAYEDILAERGAQRPCCTDDDEDLDRRTSPSPEEPSREDFAREEKNKKREKDNVEKGKPESSPEATGDSSVKPGQGGGCVDASTETAEDADADAEDPVSCSEESLMSLSEGAQVAAEDAGEYATAALRHCQVASEAVVANPPQWARAKANMHAALKRVEKVMLASRRAGVQAGRVAGLLEAASEVHPSDAQVDELEEACKIVAEAAVTTHAGVEKCSAAVGTASNVLQQLEASGVASVAVVALFVDALDQLTEMTKASAIAAIQAAEAASKAASIALHGGSLANKEGNGDEDQEKCQEEAPETRENGEHTATDGGDMKSEKPNDQEGHLHENAKNDTNALETRRAQTALLSVCRLLRRVNGELLDLQHQARRLASQDSTALPPVPAAYREQTFTLLSEYLDEAAVRLHDILQEAAHTNGSRFPEVCGACVLEAVGRCFGFFLHASAELSAPADARTQTLRAATVLDVEALQALLDQLRKRLHGSITAALLESNGGSCAGTGCCAAAASPASVTVLLAVPMQQLKSALDSLAQGLRAEI